MPPKLKQIKQIPLTTLIDTLHETESNNYLKLSKRDLYYLVPIGLLILAIGGLVICIFRQKFRQICCKVVGKRAHVRTLRPSAPAAESNPAVNQFELQPLTNGRLYPTLDLADMPDGRENDV